MAFSAGGNDSLDNLMGQLLRLRRGFLIPYPLPRQGLPAIGADQAWGSYDHNYSLGHLKKFRFHPDGVGDPAVVLRAVLVQPKFNMPILKSTDPEYPPNCLPKATVSGNPTWSRST